MITVYASTRNLNTAQNRVRPRKGGNKKDAALILLYGAHVAKPATSLNAKIFRRDAF